MPQELSITFSPGQAGNEAGTTAPVANASPILEFRPSPALGAVQASPLGINTISSPPSSTTATFSNASDPRVPTGARLRPALRLAIAGRNPRLKTRQLWEGTVTELRADGFVAILVDKTNTDNPDERATFDFDKTEISTEDQRLIAPGASFYWIIGIESTVGGQVKNVSMVQFRRVPTWTQRKIRSATEYARQVRQLLLED